MSTSSVMKNNRPEDLFVSVVGRLEQISKHFKYLKLKVKCQSRLMACQLVIFSVDPKENSHTEGEIVVTHKYRDQRRLTGGRNHALWLGRTGSVFAVENNVRIPTRDQPGL